MKLSFKNILPILLIFTLFILFAGCFLTPSTYTMTYNGNGNTSGVAPTDANLYEQGALVTVLGKGNLVKTGYTFVGWNTAANGSGTSQAAGSTFSMGTANVTLYAKWTANNYTITFDKNDAEATGSMAAQTIASGSSANLTACAFTRTGYIFAGWATTSGGTVEYNDGESYTMGSANIILYAKWYWTAVLNLRDIGPAGGLIFYINTNYTTDGWRYLEAAHASTEWTDKQWGSYGTLIGGTEKGTGAGQSNTTIIVTWLNSHSETGKAAQLCDALTKGGYSDWFLPSKDELNLMYENLYLAGVGGFTGSIYWSSSEGCAYRCGVWTQRFYDGYQCGGNGKDRTFQVRAVRAF